MSIWEGRVWGKVGLGGAWRLRGLDGGAGKVKPFTLETAVKQRSARILDPGNSRRESASFFLARPREMIF